MAHLISGSSSPQWKLTWLFHAWFVWSCIIFAALLRVTFALLHLQIWVASQFAHCMSGSVVEFLLPHERLGFDSLLMHMTFGSKCEESRIQVFFVWFEEDLAERVMSDSSITKASWCHQIPTVDGIAGLSEKGDFYTGSSHDLLQTKSWPRLGFSVECWLTVGSAR